MTPPLLDVAAVHGKLATMAALLDDLDGVGDVDEALLERDRMLRHAVERVLTQLVDLAVSLNGHVAVAGGRPAPATYRESFAAAAAAGALPAALAERLAPSAGLRNVLVHEYAAVDLGLVVRGVELARTDYRSYVRALAGWSADR